MMYSRTINSQVSLRQWTELGLGWFPARSLSHSLSGSVGPWTNHFIPLGGTELRPLPAQTSREAWETESSTVDKWGDHKVAGGAAGSSAREQERCAVLWSRWKGEGKEQCASNRRQYSSAQHLCEVEPTGKFFIILNSRAWVEDHCEVYKDQPLPQWTLLIQPQKEQK